MSRQYLKTVKTFTAEQNSENNNVTKLLNHGRDKKKNVEFFENERYSSYLIFITKYFLAMCDWNCVASKCTYCQSMKII